MMNTKPAFNSPEDQSPTENTAALAVAEIKAIVNPGGLIGTWVNVDPATRSIKKIVVAWAGAGHLTVHAYGACSPTPCDWGNVAGIAYGDNVSSPVATAFSALYSWSFKDTILTGALRQNLLTVDSYNHFKDGSGRSDYHSRDVFHR